MNEAYVIGRSKERALKAVREIILAGETEPIIDMYERAAWMSGASDIETRAIIFDARIDLNKMRASA